MMQVATVASRQGVEETVCHRCNKRDTANNCIELISYFKLHILGIFCNCIPCNIKHQH